MKQSFIFILITCTIAILYSEVAKGQPLIDESSVSEVMKHSEEASSDLVVHPSSHNYGERFCTDSVTFGFQIKNNGATNQSGSVVVYGGIPFSCISGCSFNLSPGQSQLAYIEFAPFYEGSSNGTLIAGSGATASLSGEGIELEDTDNPLYPLCDEFP